MKDILVVEDSEEERSRLQKLFSGAGYLVEICSSATEAERCLKYDEFRLAILDIGLNDRSGSHLFHQIKTAGRASFIIIFTGNPSAHLKMRFLQEGAVDYVVKGSAQAEAKRFLARVRELLGEAGNSGVETIPLRTFLERYLTPPSRTLFFEDGESFPSCRACGSHDYAVSFAHETQVPPEILGVVVCAVCGARMDPQVE